jgi:ribosome-associated heat shock protein Hsp15
MDATRVDRWVWAIRLYTTRSDATDACRAGHVKVNGTSAKPAAAVRVGDRVHVRVHGRDHDVEVVQVIDKRVGAALAAACFVDHSPPPPPREERALVAERDRGAGRPTKRDRRDLDRWRDRPSRG